MSTSNPPPLPPPLSQDFGTCCQGCQTYGPTKQVMFFQHIGAVVMMFNRHVKAQLCRNCVNEHFAKTTLVTSFFGWWGMISFFLTPIFLLHNVVRYLFCLGLKPVDEDTQQGMGLAIIAILVAVGALSLLAFVISAIFH